MIEAVILGSGTSNGVPMLGVPYSDEFLANPKNHRTRSSLLLKGPSGNLLVDCPPEMRLQVTKERVTEIDAVLITHTHADHIMGMDDLRSICIRTRRPMPVYAQPHDQEAIKRVFEYAFREFPPGVEVPRFDLRVVPDTIDAGGMEIKTFLVEHGSTHVVGIRVADFAYITDVSHIPEAAASQLRHLDTFVVDAVRLKPHPNHFHYERALEVISELNPRRAILTHLSHDYDHDAFSSKLPPGVELAFDGMRIRVGH